jgi:hypothetical protein
MPAERRRWFHGAKTHTPVVMPIRSLGNGGEPPFDSAQDKLRSTWAEPGSALAQPRMPPKALSYSNGSALEDIRLWTFAAAVISRKN